MRLGEPDASGRRRPEPVPGTEFVLTADTAVKAIGQQPRSELLSWVPGLELDGGLIPVDPETGRTSNPKYFAAGDAINGGSSAVEAVRGAKLVARGDRRAPGGTAVKEIRWHARAGQGAKTASQLLAVGLLRAGKNVQAFPEYGPERRGAPMRAYTRVDDRPIRRHDSIEHPDVVVVLEPSLLDDESVTAGLAEDGLIVANTAVPRPGVVCVPAADLAPARAVNLVMLGAVAALLGEPSLDDLAGAVVETLGKKADPEALRSAIAAGYEHTLNEERRCLTV